MFAEKWNWGGENVEQIEERVSCGLMTQHEMRHLDAVHFILRNCEPSCPLSLFWPIISKAWIRGYPSYHPLSPRQIFIVHVHSPKCISVTKTVRGHDHESHNNLWHFNFADFLSAGESCRRVEFPPELRLPGEKFLGHVIQSAEAPTENACQIKCFSENDCVSYTFMSSANGPGICNISSSDHVTNPNNLHEGKGAVYQGMKVFFWAPSEIYPATPSIDSQS